MNPLLTKILNCSSDNPLSDNELQALATRYPAFTLPGLMMLKAKDSSAQLAARVAITLPSIESYADIVGDNADIFANFYPEPEVTTPSTMETIDTFLAKYGTPANTRETDALEKAIFNPTPDYGAVLAAEEQNSVPEGEELDEKVVGEHTAAINRYIASTKAKPQAIQQPEQSKQPVVEAAQSAISEDKTSKENQPSSAVASTIQVAPKRSDKAAENKEKPQSKPANQGNLSESFARIMIKNGNYIKALEIISDLYLKNPEKSIYFADQIRFLRKLIVNENKKQ